MADSPGMVLADRAARVTRMGSPTRVTRVSAASPVPEFTRQRADRVLPGWIGVSGWIWGIMVHKTHPEARIHPAAQRRWHTAALSLGPIGLSGLTEVLARVGSS
jgi:hypothetical protein